ncbi:MULTISPECIES: GNAT family N-acetyltransferase [Sphingomonas]|uniref:GNAT family N-acetyltransferase n=1 Tax=Sphingomonas TaxID=13687 RepID=UPI001F0846C8|nr:MULTISPECIES: GNAT family protein [Sphingomonas]
MRSRSSPPDTLRTERLLLRRARPDDAPALHAIMRQPLAMRYWSTVPHPDLATTEAFVASMIDPPHAGSDEFVVETEGRVIGKFGAWRLPDFGYLLDPAMWGRGYASEALAAFIVHRRAHGSTELTADTDPRNAASIRLLQRHGFTESGRAVRTWLVGGEWCDSIYWRLLL